MTKQTKTTAKAKAEAKADTKAKDGFEDFKPGDVTYRKDGELLSVTVESKGVNISGGVMAMPYEDFAKMSENIAKAIKDREVKIKDIEFKDDTAGRRLMIWFTVSPYAHNITVKYDHDKDRNIIIGEGGTVQADQIDEERLLRMRNDAIKIAGNFRPWLAGGKI